jgi:hypothetical protein
VGFIEGAANVSAAFIPVMKMLPKVLWPNLFFGMASSFPSYSLTTLGPKKPGQVNQRSNKNALWLQGLSAPLFSQFVSTVIL